MATRNSPGTPTSTPSRATPSTKPFENERLKKEVRELQKREEDRARAEMRAAQFYELVRQGKRGELVEAWESK